MKKCLSILLLLAVVLTSAAGFAEEAEWTCSNCGSVNTGNFCVSCGNPAVSPTPVPTPEPTPAPTPEPEFWKCSHCRGENVSTNAFCRYCGTGKPDPAKEHARNPVAQLYRGMSRAEVLSACGGKEIKNVKFHYLDLNVKFKYDEYDKLEAVDLAINSSYISFTNFVYMIKKDYGDSGWTPLFSSVFGASTSKEYDDAKWTIMSSNLGNMFMFTLRIEPLVNWDNVKTGRETVQRETSEKNASDAAEAIASRPELAPYRSGENSIPLSSFVFHAGVQFGMTKEEIRKIEKKAGFTLNDKPISLYPYVEEKGTITGFYINGNNTDSGNKDCLWKVVISEGKVKKKKADQLYKKSQAALKEKYGSPRFTQKESKLLKPQELIPVVNFETKGTYSQWVIPVKDNGFVSIVNSKAKINGNWFHLVYYSWISREATNEYVARHIKK